MFLVAVLLVAIRLVAVFLVAVVLEPVLVLLVVLSHASAAQFLLLLTKVVALRLVARDAVVRLLLGGDGVRRLEVPVEGLSLVSLERAALFGAVNALASTVWHDSGFLLLGAAVRVLEALKGHASQARDKIETVFFGEVVLVDGVLIILLVVVESVLSWLLPVQLPVVGCVRRVHWPGMVQISFGVVVCVVESVVVAVVLVLRVSVRVVGVVVVVKILVVVFPVVVVVEAVVAFLGKAQHLLGVGARKHSVSLVHELCEGVVVVSGLSHRVSR